MQTFVEIMGGYAIIKLPRGVHQQVKLYHRGGDVYIKARGGFIRVGQQWADGEHSYFSTVHPGVSVLELEGSGVVFAPKKPPQYNGAE